MKEFVPAKLTRPGSTGVIRRKRLFESINNRLQKKILWISGPAGSGKTTLAASYLDARKQSCLWYQLDEGDLDPATFFYYLGLAVQKLAPGEKKPLPVLTPEYLRGVRVFTKRFFEQLCERLYRGTDPAASRDGSIGILVFDNYEVVPENAPFHEIIHAGFSSIPDGVHVLVLSRSDPPPAYARLRANGEMSLMGWTDLQLTSDESDAIVTLKAGGDPGEKTLTRIYRTTEGWVAGLLLLIESFRSGTVDMAVPGSLPRDAVLDYFGAELFNRAPEEIRAFLLQTSFLPRMSAPMAETLTGNAKALYILSGLSRKNYFTTRYHDSDPVFQYHPLFREFLVKKASEIMPADSFTDLRRRAAKVLEAGGYGEEAVNLFLETEAWPDAARTILNRAPDLIAGGRWRTLQDWIASIPDSVKTNQPRLLYWMGICRLPFSQGESREYFERAFEQFRSADDAAGSFLSLSGMLESVAFGIDSYAELDRLIALMDALVEKYPRFPSQEIERRVTSAMLYALTMRQPHNPSWKHWESRAHDLLKNNADVSLTLHILCGLAYYRLFSGELDEAGFLLDLINEKIPAEHAAPRAVLAQRNLQAMYYQLSADFEKNRWAVENGITLAKATGVHFIDPVLLGHGTAGALSDGDPAKAEIYLEKMRGILHSVPSANAEQMYYSLKAWKHLLEGKLAQASRDADFAIESGTAMGSPFQAPHSYIIKALVLHKLHESVEASRQLSKARKIFEKVPIHQARFMYLLVAAKLAFDLGNEQPGIKYLHRALALGEKYKYANGYGWDSAMIAELCVKALEAGIETEYVQTLIRRRGLVPDSPVLHLEAWPRPFKIYTLGPFEMIRKAEIIQFRGKVQQKPLLLLKALIAFGGKQVNEQQLCSVLWPDAEGDLAHRSFETTLYRLRKMLGKDIRLTLQDGRLSLDLQSCWVDAFALEYCLDKAEVLWEGMTNSGKEVPLSSDAASRAVELTQRILSLYRGHFLETEAEHPWMHSPRERLRNKYARAVEALVRYREQTGEFEEAIRCCEKALERDAVAEEFYRHLIRCYQRLGLKAEALAGYNRCRSILKAELGIEPSSRTTVLIRDLRP